MKRRAPHSQAGSSQGRSVGGRAEEEEGGEREREKVK